MATIQAQERQAVVDDVIYHLERARTLANTFYHRDSVYYHTKQAEKLGLSIGADSLVFEARSVMAYYYDRTGDVKRNMHLHELMKDYIASQKDQTFKIRGYLDLAGNYSTPSLENSDSVQKYALKAYNLAKDSNDAIHIIVAGNTLLQCFLKDENKATSYQSIIQGVSPYEHVDKESRSMYKMIHVSHAQHLIKEGKFREAISVLEKHADIKNNNNDYGFTGHVHRILADAYAGNGQYKKAFFTRKKASELQDVFYNTEKESISKEMEIFFETKEKEEAITKLEEQKKSDRRTRLTLLSVVIGLCLIGAILIFSLITYRRKIKADKALIDLQKRVDEAKTKMVTNLTHEFKTPLTVIQGMLHEIEGHDEIKNVIKRNGNQLLDLINQMLSLAKAEAGLLKIENIQSDVVPYFHMLLESTQILAQKKNINFSVDINPDAIVMDFDTQILRHIFINLLSNAIKFTPENGDIFIALNKKENQFNFSVRDTGIGMSKEDQENIFNRFYQAEHGKKSYAGGTGIGLSLVKELVNSLDGKLNIESTLGQGSIFSVSIPITNHAPIQVIEENSTAILSKTKNTSPDSGKSILIIEDNDDVRQYISSCLVGKYKVNTASNGKRGFDLAKEIIPDLIVIDYMMPIMNGEEALRLLKKDPVTDHIPVIMLTAKSSDQSRLAGLKAGANAYLTKPFEPSILQTQVENILKHIDQIVKKKDPIDDKEHVKNYPFLEKLEAILAEHYQNSALSVEEISKMLGLSRMQAHRKLKSITDMSMSKYINMYRLKKAHIALDSGKYNVSEVAYDVGYTDPSYFSKVFKQQYGMSPSEKLGS